MIQTHLEVKQGLKRATFGEVCFLNFFHLGTGKAISGTPKMPSYAFVQIDEIFQGVLFLEEGDDDKAGPEAQLKTEAGAAPGVATCTHKTCQS